MSGTILCVDDEALLLFSLKQELLRKFGGRFCYETALNPQEGLEIIAQALGDGARIDMVITDWIMPGMRGDAFLQRVAQILPTVPAVVLSGQAEESCVEELREKCNLVGYLEKPHKASDLFEIIQRELLAES